MSEALQYMEKHGLVEISLIWDYQQHIGASFQKIILMLQSRVHGEEEMTFPMVILVRQSEACYNSSREIAEVMTIQDQLSSPASSGLNIIHLKRNVRLLYSSHCKIQQFGLGSIE